MVDLSEKENKIPTIEEMKEKALKIADSIPNFKEKQEFMTKARGNIIELSIIIEMCFNQLITETGKEIVFNHEKKELYLIAGKRIKKDLPSFKTKLRDMVGLIEEIFPKLEETSKSKLLDDFNRFLDIRDIFAHVPVKWDSDPLEFNNDLQYKHFFRCESKWENVLFALSEFTQLHKWIIDIILNYNRNILLKKELFSLVLLGKSQADIQAEANKLKEINKNRCIKLDKKVLRPN